MTLHSSETSQLSPATRALEDGPILECSPAGTDPSGSLRIHARRLYLVSREDLFSTWTRRAAWDSWMRLRARSRTSLAAHRGGPFRLELAEGPTIHVITGVVSDFRPYDLLSFTWTHLNTGDQTSIVDVAFRQRHDFAELTFLHRAIPNRREAAWLMRLWTTVLGRLGEYVLQDRSYGQRARALSRAS
jgi:uncharacterized protein YndB with AHSA1/START domain